MSEPTANPERPARAPYRRIYLLAGVFAIALAMFGVYAAANLIGDDEPEGGLRFVIPEGAADTLALPTIDSAIEIPTSIVFAKGETAVLSIRNDDSVANRAGPWVIASGQTYTMSFDEPGVYEYVCSVDAAESVTITVE